MSYILCILVIAFPILFVLYSKQKKHLLNFSLVFIYCLLCNEMLNLSLLTGNKIYGISSLIGIIIIMCKAFYVLKFQK